MEQLFTQALGLMPPWAVTLVDFRQAEGGIYFMVDCNAKRMACPVCRAADPPIHGRTARRWQNLHFFQFPAYIDARLPRVACCCGVVVHLLVGAHTLGGASAALSVRDSRAVEAAT